MTLPSALLLAVSLGGPLTGCAHDAQALRTESQEKAALSAASEEFWRFLRWQDYASAATWIEDDDARRAWKVAMDEKARGFRISDVALVDLQLGERSEDPHAEHLQQAQVSVRVESYTLPAQTVQVQTLTQTWYRSHDGWFLLWDGGDPLAAH
ncbi:MAG: hypothetical protein D6798_17935 [Deltaproteobacteria bacterium]|nr:MAG: hypothetical protein D6798_17935 [Deltaproteobacteria bacterium]